MQQPLENESKISVCIRSRDLTPKEEAAGQRCAWALDSNKITMHDKDNKPIPNTAFCFDRIYGPKNTTNEIYGDVAKSIILSCVDGFNGTIFAYGQTSSGKTYTMTGNDEARGIIPLAVDELFSSIQQHSNREFLIRVSFVEIYNEEIRDLLRPETPRDTLKVMEDIDRGVLVTNLKEEVVLSADHVMDLMKLGLVHRTVGETNLNEQSSRSHAIFRILVESRGKNGEDDEDDGAVRVSCLNLVDLAGSERASSTGAEGQRLKEGCHINKSLLTLGQVISKLASTEGRQAHVPYRDSKLTRLLQPALGGNARTAIVCTITPAHRHSEETLSTLKFASLAMKITNKAQINEVVDDAIVMKRLHKEIAELKKRLTSGSEEEVDAEQVATLKLQNEQLAKKLEKLQCFLRDKSVPQNKLPRYRHSVAPTSMGRPAAALREAFTHKRKLSRFDDLDFPAHKRQSLSLSQQADNNDLAARVEALERENVQLKDDKEQLQKQVEFMEQELDSLESRVAGVASSKPRAEMKDLGVSVQNSNDEVEEQLRQTRVRVLQEAFDKLDRGYAELARREEAMSSATGLQASNEALERQVAELNGQLAKCQAELQDALGAKQAAELEKDRICEQLVEVNFKQEEERMGWSEKQAELQNKLNDALNRAETMANSVADLTSKLQSTETHNRELERKLKVVCDKQSVPDKGELKELEDEILRLSQTNSDLQQRIEELRQENAQLQSAVQEAGGFEVKSLRQQLAQAKTDLAKLHAFARTVADDNDRLRTQLESLPAATPAPRSELGSEKRKGLALASSNGPLGKSALGSSGLRANENLVNV